MALVSQQAFEGVERVGRECIRRACFLYRRLQMEGALRIHGISGLANLSVQPLESQPS